MSTYIVHLERDDDALEEMSLQAATVDQARTMATQFAGEMLRDYPEDLWREGSWRVLVRDEAGAVLCAIEIVGSTPALH